MRFGPIANYAVNSYDSARLVLSAIKQAASAKGGLPTRGDVVAALRSLHYQGIAYARPVEWDAKGDNVGRGDLRQRRRGGSVQGSRRDHSKRHAELSTPRSQDPRISHLEGRSHMDT